MFARIGTGLYTTNEKPSWLDKPFYLSTGNLAAVGPPLPVPRTPGEALLRLKNTVSCLLLLP